jgi:hypothetical protein
LLADRLGDATKAQTAVRQIGVGFVVMRDDGNALAVYYEAQLLKARGVFDRLTRRR